MIAAFTNVGKERVFSLVGRLSVGGGFMGAGGGFMGAEEEVTAGWGLMCSLIVVLVYICRKHGRMYERTDFNSNCFICFFVISLMNVCINSYVSLLGFLIVLIL